MDYKLLKEGRKVCVGPTLSANETLEDFCESKAGFCLMRFFWRLVFIGRHRTF